MELIIYTIIYRSARLLSQTFLFAIYYRFLSIISKMYSRTEQKYDTRHILRMMNELFKFW